MKLISDGAFSVCCTKDFVYFIRKNSINAKDEYYKTNLVKLTTIDIYEYAEAKFGNAWKTTHSAYTECIKLGNGQFLTCHFEHSIIDLHDEKGKKIEKYKMGRFDNGFDAIYSIDLDNDNRLWLTQPTSHYVGQFSLETEKELFSIGGNPENSEPFAYPEEVRIYGEDAYVSDMGNHRVCKIDIRTKKLSEYIKFDEPTWAYRQFKDIELVQLQSGLYML